MQLIHQQFFLKSVLVDLVIFSITQIFVVDAWVLKIAKVKKLKSFLYTRLHKGRYFIYNFCMAKLSYFAHTHQSPRVFNHSHSHINMSRRSNIQFFSPFLEFTHMANMYFYDPSKLLI